MTDAPDLPVSYADIEAAHARLQGIAKRPPIQTSRTLDAATGATVLLKCENLQRAGAFKFRGAYNALSKFTEGQRRAGVATASSGNHAQAIALSARLLGMPAVVLMPEDAPAIKVAATRGYGAEVVFYDRHSGDRDALAQSLASERGMTLVPPYDHADVIAGQGTAAKELFEDAGPLDVLVVPLGGGGLLSGSAISAHALAPGCRVVGVEPEAGNDGQQSLQAGHIVHIPVPRTLADGAQTQHLGLLTFPIIQARVQSIVTVSDAALVQAMEFMGERMKLIVEPTGCLGLAALRSGALGDLSGQRVGVVLTGGNVDLARFSGLLASTSQP